MKVAKVKYYRLYRLYALQGATGLFLVDFWEQRLDKEKNKHMPSKVGVT